MPNDSDVVLTKEPIKGVPPSYTDDGYYFYHAIKGSVYKKFQNDQFFVIFELPSGQHYMQLDTVDGYTCKAISKERYEQLILTSFPSKQEQLNHWDKIYAKLTGFEIYFRNLSSQYGHGAKIRKACKELSMLAITTTKPTIMGGIIVRACMQLQESQHTAHECADKFKAILDLISDIFPDVEPDVPNWPDAVDELDNSDLPY